MGAALAEAALDAGHDVTIISGPVDVPYPERASVIRVISTQDMLDACLKAFPMCDGVIGAAAPCDYAPEEVSALKLSKTGEGLTLRLTDMPDILAELSRRKDERQWLVGFALETHNHEKNALAKLHRKGLDLIVVNGHEAIDAHETSVRILAADGRSAGDFRGDKRQVARGILQVIDDRLVH